MKIVGAHRMERKSYWIVKNINGELWVTDNFPRLTGLTAEHYMYSTYSEASEYLIKMKKTSKVKFYLVVAALFILLVTPIFFSYDIRCTSMQKNSFPIWRLHDSF